jgi:hypothetical protein
MFRESYAKERAKVKVHVEGGGPVNLAKITLLRESFAKVTFFFAKNGRSRIKEF